MPARVRWGNVGRAAGAVALVALVVAWPQLDSAPPVLPGDEAVPVVGVAPTPDGSADGEPAAAREGPANGGFEERLPAYPGARERPARGERPPPRRRARHRRARRPVPGPVPAPAVPQPVVTAPAPEAPAPAAPAPAAPTIDPAEREFGFER